MVTPFIVYPSSDLHNKYFNVLIIISPRASFITLPMHYTLAHAWISAEKTGSGYLNFRSETATASLLEDSK
jgi:hypothetical protein